MPFDAIGRAWSEALLIGGSERLNSLLIGHRPVWLACALLQ